MTRTGTLAVFAAIRISILATAVSWTTVAAAQSLSSLSHGDNVWQSRPSNERDNPFQGDDGSAATNSRFGNRHPRCLVRPLWRSRLAGGRIGKRGPSSSESNTASSIRTCGTSGEADSLARSE